MPQPHYMVLFFDNSTMEFGDQAKAEVQLQNLSTPMWAPTG